ncbi:MAG: UDP-N-acetylglucosamine 2-epimerase (non-hydrolyzing) [Actinobacteria bacterium]|nr:UDP-N-acetylglucosamine 2-epimerase (non-hydrolyzing) [Actinomycetota bacterium]
MRIVTVVGNRPQFVKAAPLSRALRARATEILVHTGQHYDPALADRFFEELGIPEPEHALAIGAGSPIAQMSRMLAGIEPILVAERPDIVVVLGDTTTTLAGAIAAAKLDIPLAHVEAGLRSFDRTMPEEQNRVLTDNLSRLCLCPTWAAVENLAREGITVGVHLVGDVMYDACRMFEPLARERNAAARLGLDDGSYVLATAHRAATTDTPEALAALVAVLEAIEGPTVFPIHPRTEARLTSGGLAARVRKIPGLTLLPPVGYIDFTSLLVSARAVVTDSGGVQKEAYFHAVPCITLREETEWVETVAAGFNRLTGMDPARVAAALGDLTVPSEHPDLYGDGHAAEATADVIVSSR